MRILYNKYHTNPFNWFLTRLLYNLTNTVLQTNKVYYTFGDNSYNTYPLLLITTFFKQKIFDNKILIYLYDGYYMPMCIHQNMQLGGLLFARQTILLQYAKILDPPDLGCYTSTLYTCDPSSL